MNTLVVFDSVAGNTEKIAKAVAAGMGANTPAVRADSPAANQLEQVTLLIVGSPTFGGRPSEAIQRYLDELPPFRGTLQVATFDTRMKMKFLRLFGFAADKIESHFKQRGTAVKVKPEGFIVEGRTGPLADGELDRAARWGRSLLEA